MSHIPTTEMQEKMTELIYRLQNEICVGLEGIDGSAKFREDLWERAEGGGGRTRVLEDGSCIEKGGVNTSVVFGPIPSALSQHPKAAHFFACGISLVIHPRNPLAPTTHANYRYFELYDADKTLIDSWFGGGCDLTPYYIFEDDCVHFHRVIQRAIQPYGEEIYPDFKKRCDEYFYNSHRGEGRGIGGVFYDHMRSGDFNLSSAQWLDFQAANGQAFMDAYFPILSRRKDMDFRPTHREWQEIRRGRYVEFNLIHDRGTLFGLKSNGRIESILMSLPPAVQWKYDHHPEPASEEALCIDILKNPRRWV